MRVALYIKNTNEGGIFISRFTFISILYIKNTDKDDFI